ncbi:hypothetical protein EW026_g2338 [Hermanssonia centrifuga]|uniref:Uncharacterized protein n=1 Tax=Hermanssonia centrifuga TaxID=98765 RepID=A0A4S4KNL5_9APHY|nr:hypothetical protein EW026_g2338 [Hermanssonia centrifuga]
MPEFSKSLGCIDAPYIYNPEQTIYSVPIGLDKSDHTLDFGRTQAVGTIIIADGAPDATDIQLEMILRTNDESLLESVDLHIPEGISDDGTASIVRLTTPAIDSSSCMRYDVVLRVPTQLKKLAIKTRGIAQIKFAPEAQVSLNTLFVTMFGTTEHDMILPHANIRADELHLQMNRGWLVGEVSLVEKTVINTQNGDAVSNIHVLPVPLQTEGEKPAQAEFETTTGSGRSDFFYVTDRGAPHRPISSMHIASRNGDLYLTYKEAEFSGQVDLQAKSYSSTGVQGTFGHKEGEELPWVGDANGGDKLVAKSNKGWIGLYF